MKSISGSSHVVGKRFGLGRDAIFRLWKAAIKDDEGLLDEAIAAIFDRMERVDPARAEEVMSLIIRRHRGAKRAFRDILPEPRRECCRSPPRLKQAFDHSHRSFRENSEKPKLS